MSVLKRSDEPSPTRRSLGLMERLCIVVVVAAVIALVVYMAVDAGGGVLLN